MSARVSKRMGGRGGGAHRVLVQGQGDDVEIDERKTKQACASFWEVNREMLRGYGVERVDQVHVEIERDSKGGVFTFHIPAAGVTNDDKQTLCVAFKSKYYRSRAVKVTIYDTTDAASAGVLRHMQGGRKSLRTALSEIKNSENVPHSLHPVGKKSVLMMASPDKGHGQPNHHPETTPQRGGSHGMHQRNKMFSPTGAQMVTPPAYSPQAQQASLPQSMYHPQTQYGSAARQSPMGHRNNAHAAPLPPPYAMQQHSSPALQPPAAAAAAVADLPDLVAMDADDELPPLVPQDDAPSDYEVLALSTDTLPAASPPRDDAAVPPAPPAAVSPYAQDPPMQATPAACSPYLATPSPQLVGSPAMSGTPTLTSLSELVIPDANNATSTFNTTQVGAQRKLLWHADNTAGINVVKKLEAHVNYAGAVEMTIATGVEAFATVVLPLPGCLDALRRLKDMASECAGLLDLIDLVSLANSSIYSNDPYALAAAGGPSPPVQPALATPAPASAPHVFSAGKQASASPVPPPAMAAAHANSTTLNINAVPFVPGPAGGPQW
eukprot:TRINITY_DN16007_c0_g2_i1.p1 TRINITY_DN16007_c0_g2~~TRINITY_DN16007_c0_g2_i1.p1  ORF type:complete len:551 (+),score=218.50 TRINITY_DN16007_c0_g2_i1:61-1713(+)